MYDQYLCFESKSKVMTNEFATLGRKFHSLIVLKSYCIANDPEPVLEILDKITLQENMCLHCHHSSMHCDDIGDNTFLYVRECEIPNHRSRSIAINETWKNILVEPSEMCLWQVYLLMTTIHVMPFFWHGGYEARRNIFSPSDLRNITELKGKDLSYFSESSLQPDVKISQLSDEEYIGTVLNTYWNDWKGLVRETISIKIKGNKIADYAPFQEDVLFKYRSMIYY